MHPVSEEEIVSRLAALAAVRPPQERAEAAVNRAIDQLQNIPAPQRTWPRRLTLSGSAAAAIAMAVGAIWLSTGESRVSAAELLRQSLSATQSYSGWVHLVFQDGKQSDAPQNELAGFHFNRGDGTQVTVQDSRRGLSVYMTHPAIGEFAEYDGISNQIRHGDQPPHLTKTQLQLSAGLPISPESELAWFLKRTGREPERITSAREGDLERIDIRYLPVAVHAERNGAR
jgi:hypothetical protein